ncbi:MAG: hypothetical protein HZA54_03745 [Planctomycetes bacterium]|nr:hypothetical protein [Planctomycetota bacterium]
MRTHVAVLALLACLVGALPAGAVTKEEIVKLAQAGVGDEVIINQISADGTVFQLSAQEILELKGAKVSERVISFMIQTRTQAPPPGAPGPGGGQPGAANQVPGVTLVLVNSDDRDYSIQIDEAGHMIFYYYGNFTDRLSLGRGETRSIGLPPGEWVVRWVGEREAYRFRAGPANTAKLVVSGVDFADYRATNLTITVGDREVASGPLKKYVDRGAPRPAAQAAAPQALPGYGESQIPSGPAPDATTVVYVPPQPRDPVVVNYYAQPTPVVTYRHYYTTAPVYYSRSSWCSGPSRYYGDQYYTPYRSRGFITPSTLFFTGLGAALDRHDRVEGALAGVAFSKFMDSAAYGDPLFGW